MSVYDKFRQKSKLVINPKKLNCVFMSFYSYISVDSKKNKIPAVLLQMRKEGLIGFPGGKVESDTIKYLNEEEGIYCNILINSNNIKEEIKKVVDYAKKTSY